jgi:transposase
MFVRTKSTPNSPRKSIQIVENYRVGDVIKQKILRYVGIAMNDSEEQKLKDLAQDIMATMLTNKLNAEGQLRLFETSEQDVVKFLKEKSRRKVGRPAKKEIKDIIPINQVTLDQIVERERIIEGVHEIGTHVYEELGYQKILKSKRDNELLKDLVLTRLICPASKRKTQRILEEAFGKKHDLDALYGIMDKLFDQIDEVKKLTFTRTQSLFPKNIDLVLFDVTTLYFESIETDELRKFGYSKDCRFNTTQVVLALATNGDGLPVGYELFEGNKAEVTTLIASIEHWRKLFTIGSVCFVGDRAMFSKKNMELMEDRGYEYIVAAKLRVLSDEMKSKILEASNYHPTVLKEELAWVGEFNHENRRLIVSYKKGRALKDVADRKRVLEKIEKVIGKEGQTQKLISNKGVKKFTKTDPNSQTKVDEEKIEQDAIWDGLHGIITNIKSEKAEGLLARYSRLWVIEESFRINKHTLEMRPIYHWNPKRIHAHIAICYMTFALLRHLQYRLNLTQKISVESIIDELRGVQSSIYIHKQTGDLYRVPGRITNTVRKIYKAFNLTRSQDAAIYLR